jgi:hypothetical protein
MINTKEEIQKLWNDEKFNSLNPLLSRGFVFSEIQKSDILITGINPSMRKGDEIVDYDSFKYQDLIKYERYFKKLHGLFPTKIAECFFQYTDLFYHRNTEQIGIKQLESANNPEGLAFLVEQLNITYKRIECSKPKLITVFNKGSWKYWGKNYNSKTGAEIWMGYNFKRVEGFENLFEITGSIDVAGRVTKKPTQLKGTFVYFSSFIGYLSQKQITEIKIELKKVLEYAKLI